MTIDCPLTCYICGETPEDVYTVDLIGCLKDQKAASNRFKEKHQKEADGYLFVCDVCRKKHPSHTKNVEQKYGIYEEL